MFDQHYYIPTNKAINKRTFFHQIDELIKDQAKKINAKIYLESQKTENITFSSSSMTWIRCPLADTIRAPIATSNSRADTGSIQMYSPYI